MKRQQRIILQIHRFYPDRNRIVKQKSIVFEIFCFSFENIQYKFDIRYNYLNFKLQKWKEEICFDWKICSIYQTLCKILCRYLSIKMKKIIINQRATLTCGMCMYVEQDVASVILLVILITILGSFQLHWNCKNCFIISSACHVITLGININ